MDENLAVLADEIEAALHLESDLADRAVGAINAISHKVKITASDLDSTDRVLGLIYSLKPGWSIAARGKARVPNGHWRCTIRQSASRDNDEYIGIGHGPNLPHSLLASVIRAMAQTSD
jgi:hypothetical protein